MKDKRIIIKSILVLSLVFGGIRPDEANLPDKGIMQKLESFIGPTDDIRTFIINQRIPEESPLAKEINNVVSSKTIEILRDLNEGCIETDEAVERLQDKGFIILRCTKDSILIHHKDLPYTLIGYGPQEFTNYQLKTKMRYFMKGIYHIPNSSKAYRIENYLVVYKLPVPQKESTAMYKATAAVSLGAVLFMGGMIFQGCLQNVEIADAINNATQQLAPPVQTQVRPLPIAPPVDQVQQGNDPVVEKAGN